MKKLGFIIIILGIGIVWLSSCQPRIEMDFAQWGDHAYIDKVNVFDYTEADHKLQEYYTDEQLTKGIRVHVISSNTVIDSTAAKAVVSVPSTTDLTKIGLFLNHRAVKVLPIDGAPKLGYVSDFSHGPYKYKLISADETERVWTIILQK